MKLTPHPILLSLSIRLLQVTAAISPPAAKGASKGRFSACIRSEGPRRQMQDFESWVRRELQRQNRKLYQTEGPTDFRERVSRPIWPSKLGLSSYRILPAKWILSFTEEVSLALCVSDGWEGVLFCRRSSLFVTLFKRCICWGNFRLEESRKQRSAFFENLSARGYGWLRRLRNEVWKK